MKYKTTSRPSFETVALNLSLTGSILSPRAAWNLALSAAAEEIESGDYSGKVFPEPGLAADLIRELRSKDAHGAIGSTPDVAGSFRALIDAVILAIDTREDLKEDDPDLKDRKSSKATELARDRLSSAFLRVYSALGLAPEPDPPVSN
jgi:hypothetical protein